ncbi:MAG: hypothetical protein M1818_002727 [Claussenomyces sp. TS43310]|nr:MAG: hypothetical protein M1818_002727 [Claussenomyces sp. TS43310]
MSEAEHTQPQLWQEREDSITSQDPHNTETKKAKNRRPANAPVGVQEAVPSGTVKWAFKHSHTGLEAFWNRTATGAAHYTYPNGVGINTTTCSLYFDVPEPMGEPVLFYYKLTNFYQNHRRYVLSFDSNQLKGDAVSNSTINGGNCNPLRLDPNGKAYYPCGIVANSQFNDTFSNPVLQNVPEAHNDSAIYYMNNQSGIAWASDAKLYGKTKYSVDQIAVPPNWVNRYPGGYTQTPPPDLSHDEAFQSWMRTAALPTFSKLAQRNDTATMQSGTYRVDVNYNFPVLEYGGTKSVVISTRTVMGGKNSFLGIAYVVVGGICIVLGTLFTVTHLIRPRKLGDHTYLSWDNDAPSAATTTGRDSFRPRNS